MGMVWVWYGYGMGMVWVWYGYGMGMGSSPLSVRPPCRFVPPERSIVGLISVELQLNLPTGTELGKIETERIRFLIQDKISVQHFQVLF